MNIWPWKDDEKSRVAETSDEYSRDDCGCDEDDEEKVEEEPEEDPDPIVTVRLREIVHSRHTVHLGEAEFMDGDTKRFMFDAMKRKNGSIVLYDYTSFQRCGRGTEEFVTIVPDKLKTFETVRREEVRVKTGKRALDMDVRESKLDEYIERFEDSDDIGDIAVFR